MLISNFFKHLHTVNSHRWRVFVNCCRAGIPWRGLVHDLSKYSPTEFFESVKYYSGDRSPILNCKEVNGYSKAWLHHKGLNKHHWEYWLYDIKNAVGYDHPKAAQIPYKYAVEILCDHIAAGQTYQGKKWSAKNEYEWWMKNRHNQCVMHPQTRLFIQTATWYMAQANDYRTILKKPILEGLYERAIYLTT